MPRSREFWRRARSAAAAGAFGLGTAAAAVPLVPPARAHDLYPPGKARLRPPTHGTGSPPHCRCCCKPPPTSLTLTPVTAGCACIPVGFNICLTLDTADPPVDCDTAVATWCDGASGTIIPGVFRWTWTGTICGVLSSCELRCCQSCLKPCYQLGVPARTAIFADPTGGGLDWSTAQCGPFFQSWDKVQWEGTGPCFNAGLGVPFTAEITEGC